MTCAFTEPFITLIWSPLTRNLKMKAPRIEDLQTITEGAWVENSDGVIKIISPKENRTVLTIFKKVGSDGMSDLDYPLEGISEIFSSFKLYGGCYTKSAPPWSGYDLMNSILPKVHGYPI